MTRLFDARVPLRFGAVSDASPDSALLIEGDVPAMSGNVAEYFGAASAAGHVAGCPCCGPRAPAAQALSRLFLARARGQVAMFRDVVAVASVGGRSAIRSALQSDPLVSACFRLDQ